MEAEFETNTWNGSDSRGYRPGDFVAPAFAPGPAAERAAGAEPTRRAPRRERSLSGLALGGALPAHGRAAAGAGPPGRGGGAPAKRLRPFHPRCRVLYIAGDLERDPEPTCRPARGRALPREPFEEGALLCNVHETFGARGRR